MNVNLKIIERAQSVVDSHCDLCQLHEFANTVGMAGRPSSEQSTLRVVIVGEAPGKTEDRIGEPFIGDTGIWLMAKLIEVGLKNQCFLTNAVKCRPPRNATPLRRHIQTCSGYLRQELRVIKPKIVVAMGKSALRSLHPDKGLERGALGYVTGVGAFIHTWHPSYCIRNGPKSAVENQFMEHLEFVKEFIDD